MQSLSLFLADESKTTDCGSRLAQVIVASLALRESLVITLRGDLGAGKTTLVRAALRALGIESAIKSPTYTLLEPYNVTQAQSPMSLTHALNIAHLDLYRLQEPEELEYIGARNLRSDYHLSLIEWPDKGQGFIPQPDIKIQLNHKDRGRTLEIETSEEIRLTSLKDI